ncbi:lantibiotic dehydratase [Hymenobacter lucidus]|uniref:Lantibiotic dehydratase n=1 Tax=Hymenobacter lucidus TaxID=2880930 RepID=A0ABS8AW68_9BACT|nr:lantibiotic dehydratase [Hymenobacter lucidus]MCB2409847.1 lantibiotic dehydratase [Hymenobacter lucidus]
MSAAYLFDNRLIVRTPRLPFTDRLGTVELDELLQDDSFLEALYLASPVLYDECLKHRQGQRGSRKEVEKLAKSVSKYFRRMSTRCTPFGLFSGCGLTAWTDQPSAVRLDTRRLQRHTRLDMLYLCALAQKLATLPSVKQNLLFFPNTSIYSIGDELRYVEYMYGRSGRQHQISSVMASEYLRDVLQAATAGITIDQMIGRLVSEEITEEEAREFIEAVVASQLLVNELEPAITGPEFIYQILETLERLNQVENPELTAIIHTLRTVDNLLLSFDQNPQNQAADYRRLMGLLDELGVAYEEGKLFQTDLGTTVQGGLNVGFQSRIKQALGIMNKLTVRKENERIQSFIKRFRARYEDKEMPLLEVMDTETGLGYLENTGSSISPLVGNIHVGGKEPEQKFGWGKLEVFLNDKLQKAYEQKALNVDISEAELGNFTENWTDLPPSLSVMFRLLDSTTDTLYMESIGGSSAANLLGRFAHANPAINELVCDITRAEQEQNPEVVYAEVVHLPESRIGNVLLHPAFRAYEIPYLAKSSLPQEFQLDVQDLTISVKAGRVVLRSKRLNKEIIPRLSTAHNYSNNSLPVYQFLCDLQLQGKRQSLHFNWGTLQSQHQFLPRVTCHNTIIHLARWSFGHKNVKPLLGLEGEALQAGLQAFREQWNLPQVVVLADNDHELLIDFHNESMVQIWLDSVKNRPNFMLREFLLNQTVVVDEQQASYVNQFVAVLVKHEPSYQAVVPASRRQPQAPAPVTASFAPGSEWIYFKLYCGIKSADKILLNAIKPLSEELLALGLIDKWFFIRFTDPDFHLRLRFHLTDISKIGDAMRIIHSYLQPFQAAGYLWKQQLDTYNRELDRYGSNAIELAETFFYHDSVALLGLLDLTEGDERENVKWLWGLRAVDELLDGFRYSLSEKAALLLQLRNSFATEFSMEKPLKLQMDFKYRSNKAKIDQILNRDQDLQNELYPLLEVLARKAAQVQPVAEALLALQARQELGLSVGSLLSSYIHMVLNRITTSNPRLHELVLYDFLSRYYQSALARAKPRPVAV